MPLNTATQNSDAIVISGAGLTAVTAMIGDAVIWVTLLVGLVTIAYTALRIRVLYFEYEEKMDAKKRKIRKPINKE